MKFSDRYFVGTPGAGYETLKGASIHGQQPGTFKTIDKLNAEKDRVISYKSIDLYKPSYAAAGGNSVLNTVKSTLRKYIQALKEFNGSSLTTGDMRIAVSKKDFSEKRLSVAILMLSAGELTFYGDAFELLVQEAANAHITMRVHRVA